MAELKLKTINAYRKNIWHDVINDFKSSLEIIGDIKKIFDAARGVDGRRFVNMLDEEVKAKSGGYREVLTNKKLKEIKSFINKDEETEAELGMWMSLKFAMVFRMTQSKRKTLIL